MKIPSSYTNLSGTHEVRAEQVPILETFKAEGPAVDLEKDLSPVSALDYEVWLPFAAKTYHISPRIEDYIVVNTPICPSDIPNRNGIGFPLQELVRYQPPPISRMAYKAWTGAPVHYEHDNKDHTKAYGVIFDTALTRIQGYNGGVFWKVMGLAAIDKNKYPEIAQRVLTGDLDTYSMGCLADTLCCSICGAVVHGAKKKYLNCAHVTHSEDINFRVWNHAGNRRLAYLNAYGLSPIELSIVEDPAWVVALSDQVSDMG